MKRTFLLLALLTTLLIGSTTVNAGYRFVQELETNHEKMKLVYQIEGSLKKVDIYQEGHLTASRISNPKYKAQLMLMHDQRQYMFVDPSKTKEINNKINKNIEQALANIDTSAMSAKEKALMNSFLGGKKGEIRANPKKSVKAKRISANNLKVKATTKQKKIGRYPARLVNVYYKGKLYQEIWLSKKIGKDETKAINAFREDEKMIEGVDKQLHRALTGLQKRLDRYGIPVLTISYFDIKTSHLHHGRGVSASKRTPKVAKITLKEIKKQKIKKSEFQPPKDYKQLTMPRL